VTTVVSCLHHEVLLGVQGNARLAASHACVSVHSINLASERALLLWTMHRKLLTYLSGFT